MDAEDLLNAVQAGLLDDFTQADLRHADLTHIVLTGIRWSLGGTQWPPVVNREELLARSTETSPGSGIYVVTRGEMPRIFPAKMLPPIPRGDPDAAS